MIELSLMQYNVHKSSKVMAPLLASVETSEFDIIAIQEPWVNPHEAATHCPRNAQFTAAYGNGQERSCFLVNKKLSQNSWSVERSSRDLSSLRLQTSEGVIWVHSVYSQPPATLNDVSFPSPIPELPKLLQREGEHVVLGDFNLHHPWWSPPSDPVVHRRAEELVDIMNNAPCELISPANVATFKTSHGSSVIALAFVTDGLVERVIEYKARSDYFYKSYYMLIVIKL